jgi:hypothetical protein
MLVHACGVDKPTKALMVLVGKKTLTIGKFT